MAERNRLTREESRAQTRARLLESAAVLFAERGFAGTSVEDIAERAGFSRGAFYSNFEHKDDLFLALLDDRLERELHALEETLSGEDGPGAFLELLRRGGGRRSEPREWTLLLAEFSLHVMRHPALAPKLATRQQAMRAAVARLIESHWAQLGIALPMPAAELASVMLAVDDGLKLQEDLDPLAVPEDLRARILVVLLQGLAAQTKPS
ncbi:MAG: TetR/AcrR family transcriptional regulator [Acidimicrobiia bacterium]